jgi:NTP pyrophosphatase (non-canonical NTP hydrolase)
MLNALKEKAHKTAVEQGFHDEEKPDCYWLGLVMSEAGEAINADRKGKHADTKRFEENPGKWAFDLNFRIYIKDSVEDEIADIVIRLLDFAGMKRYGLRYERNYEFTNPVFLVLEREGLSSALFQLNYALGSAYDRDKLEEGISRSIMIYSECFRKMMRSDKDLWWFVEKKMRYNDLRPWLNVKKYRHGDIR